MRSLFVGLAVSSILVLGGSSAYADVRNVPEECQRGIGANGFVTGKRAEYAIVMRLWERVFGRDFYRANQFISNVTRTVTSAKPSVTVETDAFLGCRFVGMVDGATEAISKIAVEQVNFCADKGVAMGQGLAELNCALADVTQKAQAMPPRGMCYATIEVDVECSVNVDLGCMTSFDQYVQNNRFTCNRLASNPVLASEIKRDGCNLSREASP
ncbi:hypothetical protein [Polyangium sp. 15x6]|uniref:hypothetical protein n=1 Tax=Polyangium sp. 15x6 TaxID=3042687 RepID=UPI00249ABE4A|nr:hypothetical protein [Polyangium sp. 15x6]MDI3291798.1 hypothetical protein [Polyangium sp. 15x6]